MTAQTVHLVREASLGASPVTGSAPTVSVLAKDPISLGGLCVALRDRDDVQLVGSLDSSEPDVVVVACDEADERTLALVSTLAGRGARVVLVAPDLDGRGVRAAVEAGVTVAVPRREATDERLVEAVGAAASGQCSLPSRWARRMLTALPGDPADIGDFGDEADDLQVHDTDDDRVDGGAPTVSIPPVTSVPRFTRRELSIVSLLAEGRSTADIARRLAYSESTIKTVIHEMTSRLGLRNRSHAVAYAVRAGLV